jgi:hypothetical protein
VTSGRNVKAASKESKSDEIKDFGIGSQIVTDNYILPVTTFFIFFLVFALQTTDSPVEVEISLHILKVKTVMTNACSWNALRWSSLFQPCSDWNRLE